MQGSGYQTSRNTLRKFRLRIFSIAVTGEPPANGPGVPALRDCGICRTHRLPSGQLRCMRSGPDLFRRAQDSSDGRLVIRICDRDLLFEAAGRSGRRPPRTPGGTRCAAPGPPQQPSAGRTARMKRVSSTPDTAVKRKGPEELRGGRAPNQPLADRATDRVGSMAWRLHAKHLGQLAGLADSLRRHPQGDRAARGGTILDTTLQSIGSFLTSPRVRR
jgi:hypothetical protein